MKKLILVLLIFMFLITSCNMFIENNDEEEPKITIDVKDFFPFAANTKYTYEGEGNEFASYVVYVDYIDNNLVQTRTNNGGTEFIEVFEINDEEFKILLSRPETYFRQNFINTENNDENVLLKIPLEVGNSWTFSPDAKRTITDVGADIETPYGTLNAIEVTTEYSDGKTIDYYAEGVGLIKTIYTGEDYEVTSTLKTVENNMPLVQSITLFYPDINGLDLNSINVPVSFNTNEEPKDILEKSIKELDEYKLLGDNAKINKLYYNTENESVYIDFSKEFIEEMNAGSGFEAMILQSLTNTLGVYYGTDIVYITVDDGHYESGHISIEKGEPSKVNLENIKVIE